ncbi:MAG: hypothetical protein GF329_15800 [Candidatus Lokiarchaeota archaeon]|nr:hypothetical protein [Candidatus Lokiarchaeota archaeon]
MDEDSKKEIAELEGTVKDLFKNLSEMKVKEEISNIENTASNVLAELSDLEKNLPEIIEGSPSIASNANTSANNYMVAIRRFQNGMKLALLDGIKKKDMQLFEHGFDFYHNAESMLLSTDNHAELDQVRNEFAQTLFKILLITKDKQNQNEYNPFIIKACQGLAEINEDLKQYNIALTFHSRAGSLLEKKNPLLSELEYFQVILDRLLIKDKQKAENVIVKLNIKHIKSMAEQIINNFSSGNEKIIDDIIKKVEVLGGQRRIDVKNITTLLNSIKEVFKEISSEQMPRTEKIKPIAGAKPLSNEMVQNIQSSLSQGIQRISEQYPNIQVDANIDTKSIVSELKQAISSEISKEIKSMSNEIITSIIDKIPSGVSVQSPRARSGGQIMDEAPDIQIVEGTSGEKPERPKLDDMLDSVIVSE